MADNIDTQVQMQVIDLTKEWMRQMKPVFPKSRNIEDAIATRSDIFDKIYRAIVRTVTSE